MTKTSSLVKKIRSCSSQERVYHTAELARKISRGEEEIDELVRMTKGQRRTLLSRYSIEDQVISIFALGQTSSSCAQEYLQMMYTPKMTTRLFEYWSKCDRNNIAGLEEVYSGSDVVVQFKFPNSPRNLMFEYEFSLQKVQKENTSIRIEPFTDEETLAKISPRFGYAPHSVMIGALKNLQVSTGKKVVLTPVYECSTPCVTPNHAHTHKMNAFPTSFYDTLAQKFGPGFFYDKQFEEKKKM